jgi:hypothetical protein
VNGKKISMNAKPTPRHLHSIPARIGVLKQKPGQKYNKCGFVSAGQEHADPRCRQSRVGIPLKIFHGLERSGLRCVRHSAATRMLLCVNK